MNLNQPNPDSNDSLDLFNDTDHDPQPAENMIAENDDEVIAPPPISAFSAKNNVQRYVFNEPAIEVTASKEEHAAATRKKQILENKSSDEAQAEQISSFLHQSPAEHIAAYSNILKEEQFRIRHDVMLQINPADSLGVNLMHIRTLLGISMEVVAQKTKIRLDYISAIERDEIDLPYVYVSAYVRSMIQLYGLTNEQKAELMPLLDVYKNQEEVSDSLIQNVKKNEVVDEKEQARVKKIFIVFIVGMALFIALVVWGVLAVVNTARTPDNAPHIPEQSLQQLPQELNQSVVPADSAAAGITEKDLESLVPPVIPETFILKRSKTPAIRR